MDAARLLSEILALPPEERRELALRVLGSVDDAPSPEIEEAQYQEVLRRMREIDEGKVELIPWEVVRAELRAMVERAPAPGDCTIERLSSPAPPGGSTPAATSNNSGAGRATVLGMNTARLLSELLALPPEERREIALRLLDSVGEPADPALEDAWDAELQRRSRAIESGTTKIHTHDEAMEFIFGALRKKAV